MSDNSNTSEHYDVVVIGGGLAGLTAATTTARAGLRTVVLEAHSIGGRAATDERRGFHFNQGAHAVYVGGTGPAILKRLGVTYRGHRPAPAEVHGLAGDTLDRLPTSVRGMASTRLVGLRARMQAARFFGLALHRIDPTTLADRSAETWLQGLGLGDDATALVRTFTRVSTFRADLDAISADAAARQLQLAVKPSVLYIDGGWQTLVDGLVGAALGAGVEIRTQQLAFSVEPDGRSIAVHTGGDGVGVTRGSTVIVAGLAPHAVAGMLPDPPEWTGLGSPTTVACLDLGVRRIPSARVVFGIDRPLYLSTHCPPGDLAPDGHGVVQLMRYGARSADVDRPELAELARRAGIAPDDVVEERFLARMVVSHAVPVPGSGLRGRPTVDATGIPGVFLAGDWVGPVGLLADATLASAESAALAAARHLNRVAA